MDEEVRTAISDVNAEVLAVQALLFGLALTMKKRGMDQNILREAFDLADDVAIAGSGGHQPLVRQNATRVLQILEDLRKSMV